MKKFLVISNGHGEDLSGSLLALELKKRGFLVEAFALVGKGKAYTNMGIKNIGLRREFSTGGIGYTSLMGRFTELIQGQLIYLINSILKLLFVSKRYDHFVVVGDIVPVLAAWLTRRPTFVYLVAYSSHYEGKLRLPWPCRYFLSSNIFKAIYCRDQLTANDLTFQLRRKAMFLGNPFMDPVFSDQEPLEECNFRIGILPGSRRPELENNLVEILNLLLLLKEDIFTSKVVSFDVALVSSLNKNELFLLVSKYGWKIIDSNLEKDTISIINSSFKVNILWKSFLKIVQSSDLIIAMAGTATEQAVGLSKPIVQLPGKGPQFTTAFAEAQRRLLGPTVFCAENSLRKRGDILKKSADLILLLYERISKEDYLKIECQKQALLRLGEKGGTTRIINSISQTVAP
ncbi:MULTISPECIES: lipid-A-disaccharide synthase-related protein [Prochlorococcus]|uniref:lipid-A-disaccharide synthase-related protein n=1 Tax=Prochlorococcus TaxID=1218 RepID=UPI0005338C3A|nr:MULTISPECIES: lipid-A-disaccharide synthase-related protein [Prochlorococcus]KGG13256.1 hypothetical protein EV05_0935 [Prochlorococcus sp. MIT 0601]